MAETQPRRVTRRIGEAVVVTGPARIVVESIPDRRVVLAVYPEPGTDVQREARNG